MASQIYFKETKDLLYSLKIAFRPEMTYAFNSCSEDPSSLVNENVSCSSGLIQGEQPSTYLKVIRTSSHLSGSPCWVTLLVQIDDSLTIHGTLTSIFLYLKRLALVLELAMSPFLVTLWSLYYQPQSLSQHSFLQTRSSCLQGCVRGYLTVR